MAKRQKKEEPFINQLLSHLFEAREDLHVPSKKLSNYRCKITYNLPLKESSHLADKSLNHVCEEVHNWLMRQDNSKILREVMAKCVRDGSILLRVTVQRFQDENPRNQWESYEADFIETITSRCPNVKCICYNEALNQARPTKDAPFHLIFGEHLYLMEKTHTGLPYQIGPETFQECNHEVEDLQIIDKTNWVKEFQDGILVVSGRDISAFGLGYGTLRNENGGRVFKEVIAVQHCPLVNHDAQANYARHKDTLKSTVLHLVKDEMINGLKKCLNEVLERNNHPPVVVITGGGRKGLNPLFIQFLRDHSSVKGIIYNSCSSKSLSEDMELFLSGPNGYIIDKFHSYDLFSGTKKAASVLRLKRRPKTLILPIGAAGAGKSSLSKILQGSGTPDSVEWWQRDLHFKKLRDEGISLTKSKRLIHAEMISFLREQNNAVRILDSTNGNRGARLLYIQENNSQLVVFVEFVPNGDNEEEIIETLMKRTRCRLAGGNSNHPSFPETEEEQRIKHRSILKGIVYTDDDEIMRVRKIADRVETIKYQLDDTMTVHNLAYRVFLEFSISTELRDVITKK